jgi:YggT family protein
VAILCTILDLYLIALFARIILSWFPISPGGFMAQAFSFLYTITEPVLGPVRRAIPPIGGAFDISPIVVLLGIQILSGLVLGCGPGFL